MKRFLYSPFVKTVLFIALAVSISVSAYGAGMMLINRYTAEDSYEKSYEARWMVQDAYDAVGELLTKCVYEDNVPQSAFMNVNKMDIEYYAVCQDVVISNTGISDYNVYRDFPAAAGVEYQSKLLWEAPKEKTRYGESKANEYNYEDNYSDHITDSNGNIYGVNAYGFFMNNPKFGGYRIDSLEGLNYTVYVKLTDEAYSNGLAEWNNRQDIARSYMMQTVFALIIAGICFIYLLLTAGNTSIDEKVHGSVIDGIWTELRLIIAATPVIILLAIGFSMTEDAVRQYLLPIAIVCGSIAVADTAILMSLVRNMKNHIFLKSFVVVRVIIWVCKKIKNGCKKVVGFCRKFKAQLLMHSAQRFNIVTVIVVLAVYSIVLILISALVGAVRAVALMIIPLAIIAIACKFVLDRIGGFAKIYDGIEEIKKGNLNHEISGCPDGVMKKMADDLNNISDGMKESVEREVRAERMKSELITNVSHDLKTPLTSIINYSDLLCREELSPTEANDYAAIIKQKSQRLKNLTSDLFDISKVQSGNDMPDIEKIDICLLLNQAVGELNENIEKSGFEFKVVIPDEEIFIMADGKKMSRVFENLLVNCLKYSMKGTRVYVSVKKESNNVSVELKNISAFPMDFDEGEITERFVRGDASRTTEGSGLGLAIAKSYTEVCGGTFRVVLDGDLFKVSVSFPIII